MVSESIKILKSTITDTQTVQYQKKDVFKSLVEVMKNDQLILEEFINAFIENDAFWLVLIEGTEMKENFFESEFQMCIDKLEISRIEQIANYWLDKIKLNSTVNITSEILIIEALHFGVIKYDRPLHVRDYYGRKINNDIKIVHEIVFPCNYGYVRDSYEQMRYCDCAKDNIEPKFKFGGKLFTDNDSNINRLITLNPIPSSLNIKSVQSLTIGMDFDKAFWTPINTSAPYFIQHDSNGEPVFELNRIDTKDIEYYNPNYIPECAVLIRQTPEKYIHHPSSKNEWRISGMPNWWQEEESLFCPKCQQQMTFIIQLPSGELTDINGKGIYYGSDGGTTYGFWCDNDLIMGYIWQDT